MKNTIFLFLLLFNLQKAYSQAYPIFGNEKAVTINGLTFDAMEPTISPDGNALFFNSLNDGITTSLYYAAKVNDTVFNFIGAVPVVNQTVTPRLDAVATLDTANNFYWITTRDYPANIENVMRIKFLSSGYTNFGRLHGDFYINSPGYLIMDLTTNYTGNEIIYCNAYFNSCLGGAPCKSSMGIAQKINDSTFNKTPSSTSIMANINDTVNYIVYAPCISKDGLEFYYTRLLKGGTQTEIMSSVRTSTTLLFSMPTVLVTAPSILPEGPTLTTDKSKLYYHKKIGSTFKIFLLNRLGTTGINQLDNDNLNVSIFPNPAKNTIQLKNIDTKQSYSITIYSVFGQSVLTENNFQNIDISHLEIGLYFVTVKQGERSFTSKIINE